jgi:hypothetical protein
LVAGQEWQLSSKVAVLSYEKAGSDDLWYVRSRRGHLFLLDVLKNLYLGGC